ncbi:hypothetical protein JST97_12060 [bacterium]|nr:hypothetical protein [bacterium]
MTITNFLGYCCILNYAILMVWFLALVIAREGIYRLHSTWFRLSPQQFDAIHYSGMAVYKILVLVLNFVPYLVLRYSGPF